jgi:hypothetical protein
MPQTALHCLPFYLIQRQDTHCTSLSCIVSDTQECCKMHLTALHCICTNPCLGPRLIHPFSLYSAFFLCMCIFCTHFFIADSLSLLYMSKNCPFLQRLGLLHFTCCTRGATAQNGHAFCVDKFCLEIHHAKTRFSSQLSFITLPS